jgi:hypothetical protein
LDAITHITKGVRMKADCNCNRCKNKVDEYFCCACLFNFNKCESYFEYIEPSPGNLPVFGISLCPKCHPENSLNNITGVRRIENGMD